MRRFAITRVSRRTAEVRSGSRRFSAYGRLARGNGAGRVDFGRLMRSCWNRFGRDFRLLYHGRHGLRQILIPIMGVHEICGGLHGGTGVNGRRNLELRQCAGNVEEGRVTQRDGVNLTCGDQSAQHLTHFAACGKRGEEELNFFHAGGDDRLQVDRGEH